MPSPQPCLSRRARDTTRSSRLREAPITGDVFLLWSPDIRRYTRTGIVTHLEHIAYFSRGEKFCKGVTIEGDVDANSSAPGSKTLRRTRCFAPELGDRFIRRTALDGREERRELIERDLDFQARNVAG